MKSRFTRSIDDLMASLEDKKKAKLRIENNPNVLRYIEETQIESGDVAVPNFLIFWHYRNHWKCDRHYKASKIAFFRTFNKRFPSSRKTNQRYYLLKAGIFPMDDQSLKEASIYDQQFWAKKEKIQPLK